MNDFDLNGTIGFKKWIKDHAKTVAKVADVASIILGPIGMAAAGVATTGYLAARDRKSALIAANGIALAAAGLGAAKLASKGAFGAKGGVYVAKTTSKQLYVGQTNNFAIRAAQHARAGKIALVSRRLQIPTASKSGKNFAERALYNMLGTKRAPWLANKIRPPRWR